MLTLKLRAGDRHLEIVKHTGTQRTNRRKNCRGTCIHRRVRHWQMEDGRKAGQHGEDKWL